MYRRDGFVRGVFFYDDGKPQQSNVKIRTRYI